jgi:hypothetical protein
LQTLWLNDNRIGDAGTTSIGDALAYVQSRHPKCSFFEFIHVVCGLGTPPKFFGLSMGHYQGVVCMICSKNNTLTVLYLFGNKIGDAGAASIGGALAYVTFSLCE